MKKFLLATVLFLSACTNDADVASHNLSQAADNFQINRRIVFYNGITSEYILKIEGLCSLVNYDKSREVSVTCKVGAASYKKHFLGISDNVTFFVEQIEEAPANIYHYDVTFKPSTIIPSVKIR